MLPCFNATESFTAMRDWRYRRNGCLGWIRVKKLFHFESITLPILRRSSSCVELCHGETVRSTWREVDKRDKCEIQPGRPAVPKEASKLRREHLWDAVRFMGLLIGPLPDHKRIFDVHKATRLRVNHVLFFFSLFFFSSAEYLEKVNTRALIKRIALKRVPLSKSNVNYENEKLNRYI